MRVTAAQKPYRSPQRLPRFPVMKRSASNPFRAATPRARNDRAAGSGAAGAGPRNDETRSCTRSANGCAGSPRNDGATSAHAATIPDASTLARHRNDWRAAGGAMRVGGTAGEISTRGRRITAVGAVSGTTCGGGRLPPVARRTGAMRVSGVIGVEPSTTAASRRTVQPVTTESARSRSRMRAPVTSISS